MKCRSIMWKTVTLRLLSRRNLNWCRQKWRDEKVSARSTAEAVSSRQRSSAPAVAASSALKCGISTSKYKRTVWQCNHKFSNGEKCKTPHLYEDDIKKRFIEVCNRIATDKEDFVASCRQIVEMLSDTAAIDRKIEAQYIYLNGLAVSMQEFINENAIQPQGEDF